MPKVFTKNSKVNLIEYGECAQDNFEFVETVKNQICEFSKKLIKAS